MQSQTVCFVIISFFEMTTGLHQMNFLKKDIVNPFAKQERGGVFYWEIIIANRQ